MAKKYLLEIGVEEMPARLIGDTVEQLEAGIKEVLTENKITYETIDVLSTPRRLTLLIKGLGDAGADEEVTVKGPAKRIAYDSDGQITKALAGFMKGQKVTEDDIYLNVQNGEEYVYANVKKKGRSVEDVLTESIPSVIRGVNFPKSMRWGGKNLRFARPIRWIVSILDDVVLKFDLEGIETSNITKGHRFLGDQKIVIDHIEDYQELLRKNFVIVDPKERKDIIKYGAEKLAREKGGSVQKDEALLDEVTNLVEYPAPIIGRIKEEYLKLPFDVVTTPMKEHLRYFPVVDGKGRLLPYFITVRNGNGDNVDIVVKGNEKVLGARLEDAKFFYKEDIKYPLESYIEKLKTLTFQEKLGTMYDKSIRLQKLTDKIADYLEVGEETEKNVARAAELSKADLVTKMVTEFTELQGKIGMEYASESGENEIVSLALYEQYLPRFSGDSLPTTTAGAILSIADKLDSICGMFAIGTQPTGSQDPFGLRRSAIGVINIIIDKKLNISLLDIIDFSLYIYVEEQGLACDYNKVRSEILGFFIGRVKNQFLETGMPYDVIDSVIHTGTDNIYDMKIRSEKLADWVKEENISDMLTAFGRLASLAVKTDRNEVKRDIMTEPEISLFDAFNAIEERVDSFILKKDYDKALVTLGSLREKIDFFFDTTMVMVEDDEIRNNRLALLRKIYENMMKVCDLTYIVERQG